MLFTTLVPIINYRYLQYPNAVFRTRDILVRIQMRIRIHGSVPLTNEYGCGSGKPKNICIRIQNTGTFTHSSKIKVIKKSQNSNKSRVCILFCLMMEGSGAGSVLLTNGSGCGSGRPKNIRIRFWMPIRMRNTN
jgi:hypothetical protein